MSLDKLRFEKIKEEILGKAINYRKELTSTIEQLDILYRMNMIEKIYVH